MWVAMASGEKYETITLSCKSVRMDSSCGFAGRRRKVFAADNKESRMVVQEVLRE